MKPEILIQLRLDYDPVKDRLAIRLALDAMEKIEKSNSFTRVNRDSKQTKEWIYIGDRDSFGRILREGWLASPLLHVWVYDLKAPKRRSNQQSKAEGHISHDDFRWQPS